MPNTIIIGINSDIGTALAAKFIRDGHKVLGTWRSMPAPLDMKNGFQVQVDLQTGVGSIELLDCITDHFEDVWDNLIFCAGDPLPLTKFVNSDIARWTSSFDLNSTAQLSLFHLLYGQASASPSICFLAAGGVNSCPTEFSSYTLGKVVLVKAAELIAAECPHLKIFTYGPGWVPTKTHQLMLNNLPDGNRKETIKAQLRQLPTLEVVMNEVYSDINLLLTSKDKRISGRNFARGKVYESLRLIDDWQAIGKLRTYWTEHEVK